MRKKVPASIRKAICSRQGQRCYDCKEIFKTSINIHHIDGDTSNTNPANLVALCHKRKNIHLSHLMTGLKNQN